MQLKFERRENEQLRRTALLSAEGTYRKENAMIELL